MSVLSAALPKREFGARFDWTNIWNHWIFLLVCVVVLLPLSFLVLGSFSTANLPADFSFDEMGFDNYIEVWTDPGTYQVFYNTFVYTTGASAIGIVFAAILAWLVERTNLPGKIWIYAGVPMTLAMPGLIQAMAWVLLLSPNSGFVNMGLMQWLDLEEAPLNIYSLWGMSFVEGLRLVPTAFLMLVPLLRSMDPALEEAAAVSGANPAATARKITLGLMVPGIVAVTIYQAMTALEVFEVPGVLGMPVGLHVFATKIYVAIQAISVLPSYGEANALAMLYLAIGFGAALLYWVVIRRSEKYAVVTGKGYRPRLTDLGRWRAAFTSFVFLFLFLSIGLPFLVMVYASFVPVLVQPTWDVFSKLTFEHYEVLFTFPRFGKMFQNTIFMVTAAATATTVLSFLISMVIVRSRFWGRRALDMLAFIPHAIPGIVSGLALLWLFLILHVYGSYWTVAIGFTIAFIAYGTRAMNAAILQIHKDLEEAASVSGAPPWRTMWRIFVPLMMPSFIGLWIWVVLLSIRIAGMPLLLAQGPENQLLAVMIWNMWDEGLIEEVGAIATMMILGIFFLVILLRVVGFGRSIIQTR
ncbi:MAG: iron ABC transporter permease [Rhodospirillales bacterium]|jgi:iron(III) transport system permease protein|nr:iron ABC transporter permease [Rhodospirillales bacterium]MDP6843384.1 iron ABC transporter permease [Rhodospirillales bacterium]